MPRKNTTRNPATSPTQNPNLPDGISPSDPVSAHHPRKPASTSLVIAGQALRPEQKLFNQLLAKIAKHDLALKSLQAMLEAHRIQHQQKIEPLERQMQLLLKKWVVFLDQRLQQPDTKGLSKNIRALLVETVLDMAAHLLATPVGDAQLAEIYQRYAPGTDTDPGQKFAGSGENHAAGDPSMDEAPPLDEEAAWQSLHDEFNRRAEQSAALKSRRKKTARQQQAEDEQLDASKAVQAVYRKLVSALHPDREQNPAERLRKTALMVQVNRAYETGDLLTLLQLQLKAEQVNAAAVAGLAAEQLRAYNRALTAQAQSLQREVLLMEDRMRHSFGIAYGAVTPAVLAQALRHQAQQLKSSNEQLQSDFLWVQEDRGLKAWVKQQKSQVDEAVMHNLDEFEAMLNAVVQQSQQRPRRKR